MIIKFKQRVPSQDMDCLHHTNPLHVLVLDLYNLHASVLWSLQPFVLHQAKSLLSPNDLYMHWSWLHLQLNTKEEVAFRNNYVPEYTFQRCINSFISCNYLLLSCQPSAPQCCNKYLTNLLVPSACAARYNNEYP